MGDEEIEKVGARLPDNYQGTKMEEKWKYDRQTAPCFGFVFGGTSSYGQRAKRNYIYCQHHNLTCVINQSINQTNPASC